jgi:hypothetical protein
VKERSFYLCKIQSFYYKKYVQCREIKKSTDFLRNLPKSSELIYRNVTRWVWQHCVSVLSVVSSQAVMYGHGRSSQKGEKPCWKVKFFQGSRPAKTDRNAEADLKKLNALMADLFLFLHATTPCHSTKKVGRDRPL